MSELDALEELGFELARAIERMPRRARPSGRLVAVLVASSVAAGAAGALAAGLLPTGAPVRGPSRAEVPRSLAPVASSAHLAALRVDDPLGGPPWGLRLVRTADGQRCVAAGRVVNGSLAAPGKDRRFHALPLTGTGTCGDLRTDPVVFDVAAVPDPRRPVTVISGLGTRELAGVTVVRAGRSQELTLSDGAFLTVYRGDIAGPSLSVTARFRDGATRILYGEKGR
jgi:hypothetical protein